MFEIAKFKPPCYLPVVAYTFYILLLAVYMIRIVNS